MPDDQVDYYEVLGVDPHAGTDEIQKAWQDKHRKLNARINAPDRKRRHEVELQIELLKEAREVLCDDKKRRDYDQERAKAAPRMEAPYTPPMNPYNPYEPPVNPYNPYKPPMNPSPYEQPINHYAPHMNPIAPPMPSSQEHYRQSSAAQAKHKRNRRIIVRGMAGGALGGYGALAIQAANILTEHSTAGKDTLIRVAVLEFTIGGAILAIIGAIAGVIAGLIALVVIRMLASKYVFAISRIREAAIATIATIAGIVAGAVVPQGGSIGQSSIVAVVVGAGVVAGALIAVIVRKKP